jgi:serine O-acetyltransferase
MIDWLRSFSKGDNLSLFWRLFYLRDRTKQPLLRQALTFLLNRIAHRHGGYIGNGAVFGGVPTLPHGLHGVFISRYAKIGRDCWIYQNVTIGEVDRSAPEIGDGCLIGAGAALVDGIKIGNDVKIGAGAVVCTDIPDGCTVVAQPPRVIVREVVRDG